MKKREILMALEERYGNIEIKGKVYYLNEEPYFAGTVDNPEMRVVATTEDGESHLIVWENPNMDEFVPIEYACDWENPDRIEKAEALEIID